MKVVRIKTDELREWRSNSVYFVNETGEVERKATSQEVQDSFLHDQKEKAKENDAINKGKRYIKKPYSKKDGDKILTMVPGRELMKQTFLEKYGECIVKLPNGLTRLAVIRDPSKNRPLPQDADRIAPKPENCKCKDWGNPHPGYHHAVCEWNNKAPLGERAEAATGELPEHVGFTKPVETDKPISPEDCTVCKDWAMPDGTKRPENEHHPICVNKESWIHANMEVMSIIDPDNGKAIRDASFSEIELSQKAEKDTGVPFIEENGKKYLVKPKSFVEENKVIHEQVEF